MPRLRQVSRNDTDDPTVLGMYDYVFGDRDPVADPGTADGTPGNWWTTFALVPSVLKHCVGGFALYQNPRHIDPRLRELGQLRVGWARASRFVYSQHCKSARSAGVPEAQIAAIDHWQVADCYSDLERALLAYTDALAYDGGRVPDEVFAVLQEHLDDEAILEFTYITALYDMHGVMSRALRTEFDDIEETMTEVPPPENPPPGVRVGPDPAARSDDRSDD